MVITCCGSGAPCLCLVYSTRVWVLFAENPAFFAAIALANEAEQAAYGLLKSNKINYTAEGYKDLTHMISLVSKRKADIVAAIKEKQKNEVDFEKIQNCTNSRQGNQLQHAYAVQTENTKPKDGFVPWVTLNGNHTDEIQDRAETDLIRLLCETYKVNTIHHFLFSQTSMLSVI